ncbi:MAG: TetR/AcrR family transcriptional regulator [Limnobacter sp.]|uniref:TetR/AcrR family transcriptional regulator n=1 Tax=Limnobacter sp. TaxID=2003368 RepID=UPI0022C8892F|nr:TetR/AcrR family transcriptional regulator [Limnobacter sp.]MCZ8016937.1 TetR/AcrR family transcriptional regulator [Limnobacter sp.]
MNTIDTPKLIEEAAPLAHPKDMRKATLERIEKAVLELFTTRDFNNVALIEVARTANVSLQTIYKYFGSKEQLVAYVLDATLSRLAHRMIDHLEGIEDYRERLRKTLWVMLDYFDKHPKVILLLTVSIPASQYQDLPVYESPELMGAFLGMLKDGQQKGVFNNSVSSKMLLDVFMGVFGRVAQMHFLRKEQNRLIDQFDDLFAILWGALKAH